MIDKAQFYALLAATPRDWFVTGRGGIRRKSSHLRVIESQCPISSIQCRPMIDVHNVAGMLRLSVADTAEIIAAADRTPMHSAYIRAELLRACGLDSQPLNEKEKLKP